MVPCVSPARCHLLKCREAREVKVDGSRGCKSGKDEAGIRAAFLLLLWDVSGVVPPAAQAPSKDRLMRGRAEAAARARRVVLMRGSLVAKRSFKLFPAPGFPSMPFTRIAASLLVQSGPHMLQKWL